MKMKRLLILLFLYAPLLFAQVGFERTYSMFRDPAMTFIQPLKNGGYIVCGKCSSLVDNTTDFCFFKADANGNILWKRQLTDSTFISFMPVNEEATTIREKMDGSFVFGGLVKDPTYTSGVAFYGSMDSSAVLQNSFFKTTNWLTSVNALLLNANGNIVSTRDDYEGAGHHFNLLELITTSGQDISGDYSGNYSIAKQNLIAMADGGYGILSMEESYNIYPPFNMFPVVTRYDSIGHKLYNYQIQNEVYSCDTHFTSICATRDTGIMICGYVSTNHSIFLTHFNSTCDSVWTKSFGGFNDQYPATIQATNDGGYAIAGRRDYDVLLLKLDSTGTESWSSTYGGMNTDEAIYFQQTDDNGFIILASTASFGAETVYLIKTDALGKTSQATTITEKADPDESITLSPDPFSSTITVNHPANMNCMMNVFDATGRNVFSKNLSGEFSKLDLSMLPGGFYYACFSGRGFMKTQKILKEN